MVGLRSTSKKPLAVVQRGATNTNGDMGFSGRSQTTGDLMSGGISQTWDTGSGARGQECILRI